MALVKYVTGVNNKGSGSSEPLLFAYIISTFFTWAGSITFDKTCIPIKIGTFEIIAGIILFLPYEPYHVKTCLCPM